MASGTSPLGWVLDSTALAALPSIEPEVFVPFPPQACGGGGRERRAAGGLTRHILPPAEIGIIIIQNSLCLQMPFNRLMVADLGYLVRYLKKKSICAIAIISQ